MRTRNAAGGPFGLTFTELVCGRWETVAVYRLPMDERGVPRGSWCSPRCLKMWRRWTESGELPASALPWRNQPIVRRGKVQPV